MGDVQSELLIEIKNKLDKVTDKSKEQQWEKQSIYKVPASVADLNKNAYKPQLVSFGPYHHGEAHLREMEDHKERALIYFLQRSKSSINLIIESLVEVSQQLKDSYHSLDSEWQNDTLRFLRMMIHDGCFMLEILHCASMTKFDDYASKDPIFSSHGNLYIMPLIRRDMLMLENQLPMLLLQKLAGHGWRLVYRTAITLRISSSSSAQANRPQSRVSVYMSFESIYLNMIAFERFHVDAGNEVTSFVFFIDNIIDDEKDVRLLHSKGIITNALGSDKAVAKLFNSLSKDITLDPNSSLEGVRRDVNQYCKQSWNEWRAALMHTYFNNPWAILSIAAAIFLFALTIVQTIYTVLQYKAQ